MSKNLDLIKNDEYLNEFKKGMCDNGRTAK